MKVFLLSLTFTLFFCFTAKSQKLTPGELIGRWKTNDVTQTQLAEETYADLNKYADSAAFIQVIKTLHEKVDNGGEKRLQIRLLIYEILGRRELGLVQIPDAISQMETSIAKAEAWGDRQLVSELYSLYVDLPAPQEPWEKILFYYAKVIKIQEDIGIIHFPQIYRRYLYLSVALYLNREYRKAVDVGLKGLHAQKISGVHAVYRLMQYDYVASAYKELNMADSVLYYFSQAKNIADTIDRSKRSPQEVRDLIIWTGVMKGGIAQAFFMKKRYDEAIPLLLDNIVSSTACAQWGDAALALNTLSDIYFIQQKYSLALSGWKQAYHWASTGRDLKNTIRAAYGLSDVYNRVNKPDSAFYYLELYARLKDSLNARYSSSLLTLANIQLSFDEQQDRLNESLHQLNREKYYRYSIITATLLLLIIALLIYNRKRLREKLTIRILEQKHKDAEAAILQSQKQIEHFIHSIVEKNEMIHVLEQQKLNNQQELIDKLAEYTLVTEGEWEKFRDEFTRANPQFLPGLNDLLKGINPAEERLATLIYLNLNNYQIAGALGISRESVARSKRRLKQHLQLDAAIDLDSYIRQL